MLIYLYIKNINTNMFKQIISIFVILILSLNNLLSYLYDNLVIFYDINNIISLRIVELSPEDKEVVNTLEKEYVFSDGSITIVSLKWLNITKSKLNFITNNKSILTNITLKEKNTNYKNKDLSFKRIYLLTEFISSQKEIKEKLLSSIIFLDTSYTFSLVSFNNTYELLLSNNNVLINNNKWPPKISYILNKNIRC